VKRVEGAGAVTASEGDESDQKQQGRRCRMVLEESMHLLM
jgi:hypothetical protein